MIIRTVHFTQRGEALAGRLFDGWEGYTAQMRRGDLSEWVKDSFEKHLPILFIGACGIAVRHIAPFVNDKTSDSPVLVMDEAGAFVIPILSGHLGGANDLARSMAARLGAQCVLTTATDVNGQFAVDEFAKKNHLAVRNKDGIRHVSSKILAGKNISIAIDDDAVSLRQELPKELAERIQLCPYPPSEAVDVLITDAEDAMERVQKGQAHLWLSPRDLVIGMGCRRGKSFDELKAFFEHVTQDLGISEQELSKRLCAIASIDVKKDEEGLMMLAQYYHVPFLTYSAQQLQQVQGDFAESSFVQSQVGVSNVCERAALLAAGEAGELILRKCADNGMTAAAAKKTGCIQIWRTRE